jgi:hypothetical protein
MERGRRSAQLFKSICRTKRSALHFYFVAHLVGDNPSAPPPGYWKIPVATVLMCCSTAGKKHSLWDTALVELGKVLQQRSPHDSTTVTANDVKAPTKQTRSASGFNLADKAAVKCAEAELLHMLRISLELVAVRSRVRSNTCSIA